MMHWVRYIESACDRPRGVQTVLQISGNMDDRGIFLGGGGGGVEIFVLGIFLGAWFK